MKARLAVVFEVFAPKTKAHNFPSELPSLLALASKRAVNLVDLIHPGCTIHQWSL